MERTLHQIVGRGKLDTFPFRTYKLLESTTSETAYKEEIEQSGQRERGRKGKERKRRGREVPEFSINEDFRKQLSSLW